MNRTAPNPLRSQRGGSKLGCLIWLVIAFATAYIGWQIVPAKVQSVELSNHIRYRSERTRPKEPYVELLRKEILQRADELEIPLDPENLKIAATARKIQVNCFYTVQINMIVYTWDWKIEIDSSTPLFSGT